MKTIRVLELFAGIGACSKALENIGFDVDIVDAVEIDKFAIKSFNAIHGTSFKPQDITKWDKDIDVDLIMHGSPCQDFSVAGRQAGGDENSGTRSSLMYETLRIVGKLHPKYVIWENVKNLLSKKHRHNFDAYLNKMEELGYRNYYKVLNAKDFGVPQNRERVFTVSIRKDVELDYKFPEPFPLEIKLKDLLESDVDEKYYLSGRQSVSISGSDLARKVCNEAIKKGLVTPNDAIEYSYSNARLSEIENGYIKVQNSKDNQCMSTLKTNPQQIGICVASRGRGENNKQHLEPRTDGLTNTITSVQKDNYVAEINLKTDLCNKLVENGVVKGGEVVCHSYTTSQRRNTLDKYIESDNGIMPTLTTRPDCLGYATLPPNVRIRKLTPKECWRLMGFDDSDIEKAQAAGISNAQLYKQAGNSIVVNVLMAIFQNLL